MFSGTTGIANDIWFVWTATGTGAATLQSCGQTLVDTKAAVYNGAGCPASPAIACNDDGCNQQTSLSFPVVQGQQYTLQVGKFPGALEDGPGTFTLTGPDSPHPPNDDCTNATPVGPGQIPFSTAGATTDGPSACGQIGADVWFSLVSPASGLWRISTCDLASFDTVLAAYSGTCDNLAPAACNNDFCGEQSTIFLDVVGGVQYFIRVGGFQGETGDGGITISPGPPCVQQCPPLSTPEGEPCGADTNGGCSDPTNPRFLTLDCNAVICGSAWAQGGSRDTDWYRFVLPDPTPINIQLAAELPASLSLLSFNGENCQDIQLIASDNTPPCGEPATISLPLPPGTYLIVVAPGVFEGFPCGSRNAYTLTANIGRECPTQQPFFGGMRHTSLGVAALTPGSINIENTGGSGTNGADVSIGETAEGWRCDAHIPPGPLPPGAVLVAAATGTVAGIPDNTLGVVRIQEIPVPVSRLQLTPDFSPISAATYTLQAFNGSMQVFSGAGRTGPAFERLNNGLVSDMVFACIPATCPMPPCPQTGPFVPVFELRFAAPANFQISGGGPVVSADRFQITPDNPDAPVTSISEIQLTASSVDPVTIESESLVFRRLFHTALGDARFDASAGELGLGNMDAMNGDGVSVDLDPRTGHYVAELDPLGDPGDPANPIPDGAFIRYTARGIVNGVPETVYSRSTYTDVGASLDAAFDFSFTGTDQLQIVYLNSGMPVGAELLAGNTVDFSVMDGWVLTLEKTYDSCGRVVCQRPCWIPAVPIMSPSGMGFVADVLEVIAINPTQTFTGYTSADIVFSSIPSARIVNESVEFAEVCCTCDFNDDSNLNSQDFFDYLTCFFGGSCPEGRDADYNADGVVNSSDFFDFLNCFFAPPPGCN
jgi:hypothetical protein